MFSGPNGNYSGSRFNLTEHLDSLYSYAVVLSRNPAKAEDLVQETCLRALRALSRLPPHSNVKSWLFTILRHIWLNELRQWRTTPEIVELNADGGEADPAAGQGTDPHTSYIRQIERDQVRSAVEQLPPEFREIILLREYEELSYQEIAELLHCPLGTVMSRLARARSRLRDLLSGTVAVQERREGETNDNSGTAA